MTTILAPYHLDEYVPDLGAAMPAEVEVTTVTKELGDGDVWTRMAQLHEVVAEQVAAAVPSASNGVPITVLSGDCMVVLGTTAGLQRAGVDASLVWFDAHGDVQTLETTASGYVGGIPLRILTGYRPELSASRLGLRPVAEDRVLLVDARDLDPPEVEFLSTAGIRRCEVDDVSTDVLPDGPLLVHVDFDVVAPPELPGLRFPAEGGPTVDSVLAAITRILATGRVVALDVGCTWDPSTPDTDGARARLLSALV